MIATSSSRRASLRVLATALALSLAPAVQAQTVTIPAVRLATGVRLVSFTPIDSFFVNTTLSSFSIALVNVVNGSPTEYRVSHFADFRDARWLPYAARPTTIVPRSWFPPVTNGSTSITLYFQVRQKNPRAGFPASFINGKTTVEPDFFFSDPIGKRILLVYAG